MGNRSVFAKSESGFSLVEMVILLALVLCVLAIAVPSINRTSTGYTLAASARELADELNMARMLAVSRGTAYVFTINSADGTFQVADPEDPEHPPRAVKYLGRGVVFQSLPVSEITFFAKGHARGGVIELQDADGNGVRVEVFSSGRVEVKDP